MNLKKIGGGLARVGFWTGTGVVVFRVGRGIKDFGKEILKWGNGTPADIFTAAIGVVLIGTGEIIQICTIVNGVCTFSAGLDVIGGIREEVEDDNKV